MRPMNGCFPPMNETNDAPMAGCVSTKSEQPVSFPDAIKHAELVKEELASQAANNDARLTQLKQMQRIERVENLFSYHSPTEEQQKKYAELRYHARTLAQVILELVPDGADQSAAIRKVREAVMTANAGIACGGKA